MISCCLELSELLSIGCSDNLDLKAVLFEVVDVEVVVLQFAAVMADLI